MPPNLLVKAAFVRGELENIERKDHKGINGIRTDFILRNVYSYLLSGQCDISKLSARNKNEERVLEDWKETVKAFRFNYASSVKGLCSEIEVTEETVGSVLLGVSNELFCEGITWSRIVALFVFVGELTSLCLSKDLSNYIVEDVYNCFSKLVEEKLQSWIDDHDGWEGISSLSVITQQENSGKMSNPSWAKSLLYGTVRMIGTVAHLANYSNQVVP